MPKTSAAGQRLRRVVAAAAVPLLLLTGTATPSRAAAASTARYVKLAHGDALHVGDLNPSRAGVEVFLVQDEPQTGDARTRSGVIATGHRPGGGVYDPITGELRTAFYAGRDNGRGVAANIDPHSAGAEYWSNGYAYSAVTGQRLYAADLPVNFLAYWDGDLTRELVDSNRISKANANYTSRPSTMGRADLLVATGATSIPRRSCRPDAPTST